MKLFLSVEDTTIEVKVPGPYQPDVLSDMCNRANELMRQQRTAGFVFEAFAEGSDDPDAAS